LDQYTFSSVESCRLLGLDQVGTPAWSEDMHCNVTLGKCPAACACQDNVF